MREGDRETGREKERGEERRTADNSALLLLYIRPSVRPSIEHKPFHVEHGVLFFFLHTDVPAVPCRRTTHRDHIVSLACDAPFVSARRGGGLCFCRRHARERDGESGTWGPAQAKHDDAQLIGERTR